MAIPERTINIKILRADDTPYAGIEVRFTPVKRFGAGGESFFGPVDVTLDPNGVGQVSLKTGVRYKCEYPVDNFLITNKEKFEFNLIEGAPISLDALDNLADVELTDAVQEGINTAVAAQTTEAIEEIRGIFAGGIPCLSRDGQYNNIPMSGFNEIPCLDRDGNFNNILAFN